MCAHKNFPSFPRLELEGIFLGKSITLNLGSHFTTEAVICLLSFFEIEAHHVTINNWTKLELNRQSLSRQSGERKRAASNAKPTKRSKNSIREKNLIMHLKLIYCVSRWATPITRPEYLSFFLTRLFRFDSFVLCKPPAEEDLRCNDHNWRRMAGQRKRNR